MSHCEEKQCRNGANRLTNSVGTTQCNGKDGAILPADLHNWHKLERFQLTDAIYIQVGTKVVPKGFRQLAHHSLFPNYPLTL